VIHFQKTICQISEEYRMKSKKYLQPIPKFLLPVFFLGALCACVPTTPQWDKQFGDSVRQTRAQQIMNPQAGGDAPVNGVDGAVARESIGRYRSSFREPLPAPTPMAVGTGR
jgi:hypothetical protein